MEFALARCNYLHLTVAAHPFRIRIREHDSEHHH